METLSLLSQKWAAYLLGVLEPLEINNLLSEALDIAKEIFLIEIQGLEYALCLLLKTVRTYGLVFEMSKLRIYLCHQCVIAMSLVDASEFLSESLHPLQVLVLRPPYSSA